MSADLEHTDLAAAEMESIPNPNATQNRVPSNQELNTLRSIARSKSQISEIIQSRTLEAQTAYEGALERYRTQKLALDSFSSEVHTTRQFYDVLAAQKNSLDEEMDELRGLLNPVRRLSTEILSNIFSMVVNPFQERNLVYSEYEYHSFRWSTYQLMLVCRFWRDVTVQCPALWTVITVDLGAPTPRVEALWKISVRRIKNAPASILLTMGSNKVASRAPLTSKIDDQVSWIKYKQKELQKRVYDSLRVCDLRQIPVISKLRIESTYSGGITHDLSRIIHFPAGKLEALEINDRTSHEEPLDWWSWTTFLKRFPPFTTLTVRGVHGFELDDISQFPTVKHITLEDHRECAFPDVLLAFPNLEYLHVGPLSDQWNHAPPPNAEFNLVNLKSLSLEESFSFPDRHLPLKTPNLTSFRLTTTDGGLDDEFCDFLTECKSLTSVELGMMEEASILPLALATDTLLHLTLKINEVDLLPFIRWEDTELSSPPFPKLRTLTLHYDSSHPIRLDAHSFEAPPLRYLDELVTTRCLPRLNGASRLHALLYPLDKLVIKDHKLLSSLTDSAHYQSATTRIIEVTDHESVVTLSWVLEEEAVLALGPGGK